MAREQWKDLYLRHNFDDTGLYPIAGSLSASPDIIQAGRQPFADPTQLITENDWKLDAGNAAAAREPNHIYLRGQNLGDKTTEGRLYLYASRPSLLFLPTSPFDPRGRWSQNPIRTSKGAEYVTVNPAAGARFVTSDPFLWNNYFSDEHYSLISRVVTTANPNPIPEVANLNDFAAYISSRPNLAWHNITAQNPENRQWTMPSIDYEQSYIGGEVYFVLKCVNAPDGSRVTFSAGTPGANPPLMIAWTEVKNSSGKNGTPTFVAPLATNIPANWSGRFNYIWDSNGKTPLPNMKISLEVLLPIAEGKTVWDRSLARFALPLEEIFGVPLPRERWTAPYNWSGPHPAIALGSHGMQTRR